MMASHADGHSAVDPILRNPRTHRWRCPEAQRAGKPSALFGSQVAAVLAMPFRRLYWRLLMRLSVMCMREWIDAR
jgi:hypothetical protein